MKTTIKPVLPGPKAGSGFVGGRPTGGKFAAGGTATTDLGLGVAAASGLAAVGDGDAVKSSDEHNLGEVPMQAIDINQGATPSLQHLEAPINNMVMKYLEENQQLAATFFKVTGLTPTRAADWLIQKFHSLGRKPSRDEVTDVILDAMDSASERNEILKTDEHFEVADNPVTEWDDVSFSNLRVAVATVRAAANVLPGGIHDLIVLRAALAMRPDAFAAAVRNSYGFEPNVWFGDRIQDASEQVRVF